LRKAEFIKYEKGLPGDPLIKLTPIGLQLADLFAPDETADAPQLKFAA
jgi:hypothetical protein